MRSSRFFRLLLTLGTAVLLGGTLMSATPSAASAPSPDPASAHARDSAPDLTSDIVAQRALAERRAAKKCKVPRCWVAISYNKRTGRSAAAINKANRKAAMRQARKKCQRRKMNRPHKKYCTWPGNFRLVRKNGCIGIARRRNANGNLVGWGAGRAFNKRPAMNKAKRRAGGKGKVKVGWACSRRRK